MIGGAFFLVPVSPPLIFGLGPLPRLGIAGGAVAVLSTISSASRSSPFTSGPAAACCAALRPPRLSWAPLQDILRVGLASSAISLSTNVTAVVATGLAGLVGPAAVAGYGTGVRLEYLLVPLVFGLGQPVGAMVGTAIGAGRPNARCASPGPARPSPAVYRSDRHCRRAVSAGLAVAVRRRARRCSAYGSHYLRIVGPFYGFFGAGLALYFASQGAGRAFLAGDQRNPRAC